MKLELEELAEPKHIIIRVKDKGKDPENTPFVMKFSLAKLINENKLNIYRTGGHYFLVIDTYEIGLPLKALKEIVSLALALMSEKHAIDIIREWEESRN